MNTRKPPDAAATRGDANLPELDEIERIAAAGGDLLDVRVACTVDAGGRQFPVHVIAIGNPAPEVPAAGFFGGVHGLERIGAEVVLAFLGSLVTRLQWDDSLHRLLDTVRLVFMPVVNPGGIWRGTRANPNGIDLMRNAPVDSHERVPFLVGGHRLGAGLPWYRGRAGEPMQAESRALCELVERELLSRRFSVAVDCHSGFGINDRIWFPYAHTCQPIAHLPEMHALMDIFARAQPNHRYVFEPQSRQYLAHGDLWDHLYLRGSENPGRVFLPLTLEMGSWLWVRKNPRQMFSRLGIFNPLIAHRQQRVLRRHMGWLDFLTRAAASHRRWLPAAGEARELLRRQAVAHWYCRDGR